MKKILLLTSALMLGSIFANAAIITSTLSNGATNVFLLSGSRASVYNVQISLGTQTVPATVELFDCHNLGYVTNGPAFGTNIINAAYIQTVSYSTNMITTFVTGYGTNYAAIPVGSYNITNYTTNAGWFTLTNTAAAATNVATPLLSFTVAPNSVNSYNVDALFSRGIVARLTTTTNAGLVINYNTGQ